jgi:8-oxo-dGTP pyrophosphatase MutT (NUDIX family)
VGRGRRRGLLDHGRRMYPTDLLERLATSLDPDPAHRPPPGDRLAGVLLPVVDSASLLFTRRSEALSRHAGEISFPGGIRHDEDASVAETALRETEEELGIGRRDVDLLGALPPVHTFVSGILIVPFVGLLRGRPPLRPSADEIAEVLEYRMDALAAAEQEVEWSRDGAVYRGYAYEMGPHTIWGATARIVHSFLDVLARTTSGPAPE